MLLLLVRNILIDGEASYMAQACELASIWETLPRAQGAVYPLSFPAADIEVIQADAESAAKGTDAMRRIRESLGDLFLEQDYASSGQHQRAVDVISRTRAQVLSDILKSESNVDG